MSDEPGYWKYETSGVLRPAIEAYLLSDRPMTVQHIGAFRAYLRQWIDWAWWRGPMIDVLRTSISEIATRKDIDRWLERALEEGIDPL